MKYLLHLTLFLLAPAILAQAPTPSGFYRIDGDLKFVKHLPGGKVIAVGTEGVVMHSPDDGATWKQPYSQTNERLYGVDMNEAGQGIAVGRNGTIIITADGGLHWKRISKPTTSSLYSVSMYGTIALTCGFGGIMLRSTDAGNSWTVISNITKDSLNCVVMLSENIVLASGYGKNIMRSTDGGLTWTAVENKWGSILSIGNIAVSPGGKLAAFVRINAGQSMMVTSGDSGITWEKTGENTGLRMDYSHFTSDTTAFFIGAQSILQPAESHIYTLYKKQFFLKNTNFDSTLIAWKTFLTSISFRDRLNGIAVGTKKTIYTTTDGGTSWQLASHLIPDDNSNAPVFFINDTVGWMGSNKEEQVYRTRNGGVTWLPQRRLEPKVYLGSIQDVHFRNEKIGFAISSNGGGLLHTEDGGETYERYPGKMTGLGFFDPPTGSSISFIQPSNWIFTVNYRIHRSTDNGLTWDQKPTNLWGDTVLQYPGPIQYLTKDIIITSNTILKKVDGVTVDSYCMLLRSEDRGETWQYIPSYKIAGMSDFHFFNKDTGLATGGRYDSKLKKSFAYIFHTTDGGMTWTAVDSVSGRPAGLGKLSFIGDIGYAAGTYELRKTEDRGLTWKSIVKAPNTTFSSMAMPSLNTIYLKAWYDGNPMGDEYHAYKSIPADELTSVDENTEPPAVAAHNGIDDVWMREAFPNPFSSKIQLKVFWSLELAKENISLKVFNAMGNEVADITNIFRQSTGNDPAFVEWDAAGLPNGLYFVQAKGGNSNMMIQVILAR